jgi:hypothetical protein
MITETFTIKKNRIVELQAFIKKEMPTFRFCGNPIQLHDVILIRGTYEIGDSNKLSKLQSKWYLEDNPIKEPKPSLIKQLKTWIQSKLKK